MFFDKAIKLGYIIENSYIEKLDIINEVFKKSYVSEENVPLSKNGTTVTLSKVPELDSIQKKI